jgi:hypothetical protein
MYMKKFELTFIQYEPIKLPGKQPLKMLKQEIITDQDGITIVTPPGYVLFQIVEILPQLNQSKNEKAIN